MARSRQDKEKIVSQLTDDLKKAKSVVFSTYHGLTVSQVQELRKRFRQSGVRYTVSKKTLMKLAFKGAALPEVNFEQMDGAIAVSIGLEDEVSPAKVLSQFAKEHEQVKMLGGILEGRFIGSAEVAHLSKIPSRNELLGSLVVSLASPMRGLLGVLQGNVSSLLTVLKAISEQKS